MELHLKWKAHTSRPQATPPLPYSGVLSPRNTPIACLVGLSIHRLLGINPVAYETHSKR